MIVKRDSTDASESGSCSSKKIHPKTTVIVAMTQTIQEIIRSGDKGRRKDESGRSADEEEDDNDDFSIKPFKIHLAGVEDRIVMLPNTHTRIL